MLKQRKSAFFSVAFILDSYIHETKIPLMPIFHHNSAICTAELSFFAKGHNLMVIVMVFEIVPR